MQAILLAAGVSRRFGTNKLLHPLPDGTPIGLAAARNLALAMPGALAIVNGDDALAGMLRDAGLRTGVCPQAMQGMGASLAWGVAATAEAEGWLVALADMPFIAPSTIARVAALISHGAAIAAPVYQGQRGHPVAFGSDYRQALLALTGDTGARGLLQRHGQCVRLLSCDDPGVLRDIDSVAQLAVGPTRQGRTV